MTEDTVGGMQMLSPTDTPSVSTVLEEIFQYIDRGGRCHPRGTSIQKHIRLRLALWVFGDAGYARLDTTIKPMAMVVPTAKLLKLLEITSPTTDLEPLILQPVPRRIGKSEAIRQSQYMQAFKSAMTKRISKSLVVPADFLNCWERGLLRHGRRPNGDVAWFSIEANGEDGSDEQPPERLQSEPPVRAPMQGVELEFEIDDENILLLHEDDPHACPEVLEVLQISHKELESLFKTAAKLLAQTNQDHRMRTYAVQGATGKWQVELLPP